MREAILSLGDSDLEAMGFGGLVSTVREAGIRDVELLEDRGTECVPQVEVEERLDPEAVRGFECVDRVELVAEKDETYLYLLELTATGLPECTADDHEALVGNSDTALTERGLLVSLVGSQEAIREMLRNYEAAGATPSLRKLSEYDGGSNALDALTDRQLTVITTAFELGFYDVPRAASTEDVAGELNLDPATVSEHLQRAERNLLTRQLPT